MKNVIRIMGFLSLSVCAHAEFSGLYLGVNAAVPFYGVSLASNHAAFTSMDGVCNSNGTFVSFSPGAQFGFLYEFSTQIVVGLEATYNYNTPQSVSLQCQCPTTPDVSDSFVYYDRMRGSLRGRVGYALFDHRLLPFFVIGGDLAALSLNYSNENKDSFAIDTAQMGWRVGAGLEWKLADSWSVRGQYQFSVNGNVDLRIDKIYGLVDPNGAARASAFANTLELAASYWF